MNLFCCGIDVLCLSVRSHEKAPHGTAGGARDRFRCEVPDESGAHRHQLGAGRTLRIQLTVAIGSAQAVPNADEHAIGGFSRPHPGKHTSKAATSPCFQALLHVSRPGRCTSLAAGPLLHLCSRPTLSMVKSTHYSLGRLAHYSLGRATSVAVTLRRSPSRTRSMEMVSPGFRSRIDATRPA